MGVGHDNARAPWLIPGAFSAITSSVKRALSVLSLAVLAACSSSTTSSSSTSSSSSGDVDAGTSSGGNGPPADYVFGGARPVTQLKIPDSYDAKKPAPLVIVLHGYSATAATQNLFFNLGSIADKEGFILVAPEGMKDSTGNQFWNATDNCCNFDKKDVDDVAYITGLVDELAKYYSIDPKRVFLVGHSNGGAMSFRLGCDASQKFAAIVDLAGPFFVDATKCKPTAPVALLHLHGTKDATVPYPPATTGRLPNPGAEATVATWAANNGCGAAPDTTTPAKDVDLDQPGAETKVSKYPGCRDGADVELWTLEGTGHIPLNLTRDLPSIIYAFLSAHPKR